MPNGSSWPGSRSAISRGNSAVQANGRLGQPSRLGPIRHKEAGTRQYRRQLVEPSGDPAQSNHFRCRAPPALLPLRLGAMFHSRLSLLAKMEQWESVVIDFLNSIGDGQEWAAKIYIDPCWSEERLATSCCLSSLQTTDVGAGTRYLTQKRDQHRESRALQQRYQEEVAAIETSLMNQADRYCRSRPLPANLTGRREKMLWNAAFLLPRSASERWLAW